MSWEWGNIHMFHFR